MFKGEPVIPMPGEPLVAKVPTAALKGTQESQGRRPRPWKGKVVSQGSRVLEDARKISRPAELGFVVLGIILPGRAPN